MSEGAFEVHGLSDAFLSEKQVFRAVADELHRFFGDARLVAHNAAFDIAFINAEFARTGHGAFEMARVVDTLALARRRHPGASNSLDALCGRYGIDNRRRLKHGALLDAELLAEVYIELLGGKQTDLGLAPAARAIVVAAGFAVPTASRRAAERPANRALAPAELARHADFVATLGSGALWSEYLGGEASLS